MKTYYVYILSSTSGVIYIGISDNLERRYFENKLHLIESFTRRYNINKLIYFEESSEPLVAIAREKQLKRWSRKKKILLIGKTNPQFIDFFDHREIPRLRLEYSSLRSG